MVMNFLSLAIHPSKHCHTRTDLSMLGEHAAQVCRSRPLCSTLRLEAPTAGCPRFFLLSLPHGCRRRPPPLAYASASGSSCSKML